MKSLGIKLLFIFVLHHVYWCISSVLHSVNLVIYPEKVIWFHKEVRHNKVIILALEKALAASTHCPPLHCTDVPAVTITFFLVHKTVLLDRGEHQLPICLKDSITFSN